MSISTAPLPIPAGESADTAFHHLQVVRYVTVAAFTVYLYDIIITYDVEHVVVWSKKRLGIPRLVYIITRYGGLGLFTFYLAFLMPTVHHSDTWFVSLDCFPEPSPYTFPRCQNAVSAIMATDVAIETLGNGIILYELIYLWGSKGNVSKLMASGFIILHSATVASTIVGIHQSKKIFHFIDLGGFIRVCATRSTPSAFRGVYIPAVILDVFSFTLLLLNVLSRPRSTSQNLLDLLLGDGLIFFLTTLSMRTMCLLINILAPPDLGILGLIAGSTIVILAICRLFLRLNKSQVPYSFYDDPGCLSANEVLLCDETELRFRRSVQ